MKYHRIFSVSPLLLWLIILLLTNSVAGSPTPNAVTTIIRPISYTTTGGGDGDQPVEALHGNDQSETQNNWNKYVEFTTPNGHVYDGFRRYILPDYIDPASLTEIKVEANYLGPPKSRQTWTWRIYDWTADSWATIGDNAAGLDWRWSYLTFTLPGTLPHYVNGDTREIRIRLTSLTAVDNADLDYEAVIITANVSPTPTETPIPPTPTPTPTETPVPPTLTNTPLPPPTDTPLPPPTETARPTPTDLSTPTNTPHPPPTETPRPTSTQTPTLSPTFTPTPTSTQTPTPSPTLSPTPTSPQTPTPIPAATPVPPTETPTPIPTTIVLHPTSYTTLKGGDGGQPVSNLHLKDQSGDQNNWDRYIEFTTPQGDPYRGYRTYILPAHIDPAFINAIQIETNYLGPAQNEQTWTWRIYDWTAKTWVALGDNTGAPNWRWHSLTFEAGGLLANYVESETRVIRIQFVSNNAVDNSDIDYEAITISAADVAPTPSPTLSPSPTLTSTLSPTSVLTQTPPLTPTLSPTPASTQTPTLTPTLSPTLTPTFSPTPTLTLTPTLSPTLTPTFSPPLTPTPTETPVPPTETPTPASTTIVLHPTSYTTLKGGDGGQPVSNLHLQDQSDARNDWDKYIEFTTPQGDSYQGYRTYILPDNINPAFISAIQIETNYLGPAQNEQTWTWRIYDWTAKTWVALGDNTGAPGWRWHSFTFEAGGPLANYVESETRVIRIQFESNNAVDNSDIDYEAVIVSAGDAAPPPSPTPTMTPSPLPPGTYYVAPNGVDGNDGSLAAPWRTIQKAADTVPPGSTVYVREGVYNEAVTINVSGSETGGYITFQNYPGETAILDGTGLTVPAADNGLILIIDKSYLIIKGFEIRNYKTNVVNRTPVGVRVLGTAHHLEIRDNRIHAIETNAAPQGSALLGADAHGIAVHGTNAPQSVNNIIITGNELYNLKLGSSEALVLNGNVEYFEIVNNIIHDNDNIGVDLIGFEETAPDPAYDQARYGVIRGNTIYNIDTLGNPAYASKQGLDGYDRSAGGIYVDGGTVVTIEQNVVHAANIGVEIASEHKGRATSHITIRNNVLSNNGIAGLAIGGYDPQRGSTENCVIVNNTLYHNDTFEDGNGELLIQYDTRNNIIKNNIFYAGSQGLLIGNDYTQNSDNVVDYNLYFVSSSAPISEWQWRKRYYDDFTAYRTATGNDAHSLFIDPQFTPTSNAAFDFHLAAGSPAIDAGQALTEAGDFDIDGQVRIQGEAIDLGADEAR